MDNNQIQYEYYSFGGVGTNLLLNAFNNNGFSRVLSPGAPHSRNPSPTLNKCVYLYGDPRNSLLSHLRRHNEIVLSNSQPGFNWLFNHTVSMNSSRGELFEQYKYWELNEILEFETDPFEYNIHFKNWIKFSKNFNVLWVEYEKLSEETEWEKIANFLEWDKKIEFEFVKRQSNYLSLTKKELKKLNHLLRKSLRIYKEIKNNV